METKFVSNVKNFAPCNAGYWKVDGVQAEDSTEPLNKDWRTIMGAIKSNLKDFEMLLRSRGTQEWGKKNVFKFQCLIQCTV